MPPVTWAPCRPLAITGQSLRILRKATEHGGRRIAVVHLLHHAILRIGERKIDGWIDEPRLKRQIGEVDEGVGAGAKA